VPPDDALGLNHDQVAAPGGHEPAGQDPEEPVVCTEPRAFARGTGEDEQLLTQEEILGDHLAPPPNGPAEQFDPQQHEFEHHADIMLGRPRRPLG